MLSYFCISSPVLSPSATSARMSRLCTVAEFEEAAWEETYFDLTVHPFLVTWKQFSCQPKVEFIWEKRKEFFHFLRSYKIERNQNH